jgi:hypothetical protein
MKRTLTKLTGIAVLLFTLCTMAMAQEGGKLQFEKQSHYFGTFKRTQGVKKHAFNFENKSDKPVMISRVKATCGCTAVNWSRKPILPGEKGFVEVQFNPRKFSGYFSKRVSVFTNTSPKAYVLQVSGRIRVNRKISDEFVHFFGDLKANKTSFSFGDVANGQKQVMRSVKLINIMRDTIVFNAEDVPKGMKLEQSNTKIAPGGNCRLNLSFVPNELNTWGSIDTLICFSFQRGGMKIKKSLPVEGNIIDDFTGLSDEDKKTAPMPKLIAEDVIHLPSVKQGKLKTGKAMIVNRGKTDLKIRNVELQGEGLLVKKFDKLIPPGKTGKIIFTYDSASNKEVKEGKMIVWSNAPDHYKLERKIIRE